MWTARADRPTPSPRRRLSFHEAWQEAYARSLPLAFVALTALVLSMAAVVVQQATSGTLSDGAGGFALWAFIVFAACALLNVPVVLFNVPKFVVPPASREPARSAPVVVAQPSSRAMNRRPVRDSADVEASTRRSVVPSATARTRPVAAVLRHQREPRDLAGAAGMDSLVAQRPDDRALMGADSVAPDRAPVALAECDIEPASGSVVGWTRSSSMDIHELTATHRDAATALWAKVGPGSSVE